MSGPVDRYLDDLFDDLSGTGAAGRRALAEAEDHLRAAADGAVALGVPVEKAERDAVDRFGPPARIAAQLRWAHGRVPLLSSVWFLAALGVLALAGMYVAKSIEIMVLLRMHPEGPCIDPSLGCSTTGAALRDNTVVGLALLVVGVFAYVLRAVSARWAGLGHGSRRLPLWTAVLFGMLCPVLLVLPKEPPIPVAPGPGFHHVIIGSAIALVIAIGSAGRYIAGRYRSG